MGIKFEWLLYLSGLVAVAIVWWLVQNQAVVGTLLGVAGGLLVLYVLGTAVVVPVKTATAFCRDVPDPGLVLFWALFEQAGSCLICSLTVMSISGRFRRRCSRRQRVHRCYWRRCFRRSVDMVGTQGLRPSAPIKFGLAMMQLGLGFYALKWGADFL